MFGVFRCVFVYLSVFVLCVCMCLHSFVHVLVCLCTFVYEGKLKDSTAVVTNIMQKLVTSSELGVNHHHWATEGW